MLYQICSLSVLYYQSLDARPFRVVPPSSGSWNVNSSPENRVHFPHHSRKMTSRGSDGKQHQSGFGADRQCCVCTAMPFPARLRARTLCSVGLDRHQDETCSVGILGLLPTPQCYNRYIYGVEDGFDTHRVLHRLLPLTSPNNDIICIYVLHHAFQQHCGVLGRRRLHGPCVC